MTVPAKPDGYHSVTPYLTVNNAARLIEFAIAAFGATTRLQMARPDGSIAHAELQIGDSVLMIAEATAKWEAMPGGIHLYVDDVDATYQQALDAGALSLFPPDNQFYGDRVAGIMDVVGNNWWLATHVEDVPQEEIERRAAEQKEA